MMGVGVHEAVCGLGTRRASSSMVGVGRNDYPSRCLQAAKVCVYACRRWRSPLRAQ
jgi:hypothetical protein